MSNRKLHRHKARKKRPLFNQDENDSITGFGMFVISIPLTVILALLTWWILATT